jgi:hypothetical protein
MSESDKPLCQQIDDGMEAIRHQLERLRERPTMGGPSDDLTVIADLEAEYQAHEAARTGLGPHEQPMSPTAGHLVSSGQCLRSHPIQAIAVAPMHDRFGKTMPIV